MASLFWRLRKWQKPSLKSRGYYIIGLKIMHSQEVIGQNRLLPLCAQVGASHDCQEMLTWAVIASAQNSQAHWSLSFKVNHIVFWVYTAPVDTTKLILGQSVMVVHRANLSISVTSVRLSLSYRASSPHVFICSQRGHCIGITTAHTRLEFLAKQREMVAIGERGKYCSTSRIFTYFLVVSLWSTLPLAKTFARMISDNWCSSVLWSQFFLL